MDFAPFALVAVSSISHALWNYMAKGSTGKVSYIWLMNLTSQFTVLPFFILLMPGWGFPWEVLPLLVASSVAEIVYFLALARAYEIGDLSIVYPLARSSPIFVALFSVLFLGEELSFWGVAGVLLIVLGVYTLHLRRFRLDELLLPLHSIRARASQLAILAAAGTTVYSLLDKLGVTIINPVQYAFWLEIVITILLTPLIFLRKERPTAETWRDHGLGASLAGFLMRGGYLLVLIAMTLAPVSYILALRQVSVVIGAALGVALLRERYGRVRMLSSVIIFVGVYILGTLA